MGSKFSIISKDKIKLNELSLSLKLSKSDNMSVQSLVLCDYGIYSSLRGVFDSCDIDDLLDIIKSSNLSLIDSEDFLFFRYDKSDNVEYHTSNKNIIVADDYIPYVKFFSDINFLPDYVVTIATVELGDITDEPDGECNMNEEVLQNLLDLSENYKDYEFYFTGIDTFAYNLPCVGSVINETISEQELNNIDLEISCIISKYLEEKEMCGEYGGFCMVPISTLDKTWFYKQISAVYVKNGEVIKKSKM